MPASVAAVLLGALAAGAAECIAFVNQAGTRARDRVRYHCCFTHFIQTNTTFGHERRFRIVQLKRFAFRSWLEGKQPLRREVAGSKVAWDCRPSRVTKS